MANIVLVTSDEHNPRYASPYGHPSIQTPFMQEMADAGVVFEHAYCPSPLCMPSRSAFIAGRWVHEIQTYSNCNVGMEGFDYPSFGGVLAAQGVHTVHVGKMDAYRPAAELGFSEVILPGDRSLPGDPNWVRSPLSVRTGAAQRASQYGPHPDPWGPDPNMMDAALSWLHERATTLDQPWILSVNLIQPHFPHFVEPAFWQLYADGADLPRHGIECPTAQHPYAVDLRKHFETDQFTEEQIRGLRRGYLGCVTYVDRQLGRLVQALRQLGLDASTNLIYTSDHGEMLGKFGLWWKCVLYEDAVRVPLIAVGPDFSSGVRVATPVSTLDLQASLFACVQAERPGDWQGEPLQSIREDDEQRVVFSEYHGHGTRSGAFMVRQGAWKLIHSIEAPHQLFDLDNDTEEVENLFDVRRDKASALEGELRRICNPETENARAHAFERRQRAIVLSDDRFRSVTVA